MLTKQNLEIRNEWWSNENYKIIEESLPKRDLYNVLADNFKHTLILNIIGLRRVGKSTILKQLVAKLLKDGVKPCNVFYFLFDYTTQLQKAEFLDEVLTVYFREILKKAQYSPDESVYIFLDEIQYIENWQSVLKRYYDLSNKQIKFIVTGSQSVLLKGKHQESLAGRIFDFYLPPMSFREFLTINQEDVKILDRFDFFNLKESYNNLSTYHLFHGQKIIDLTAEYLVFGQFPEIRKIDQENRKHDYILDSVIGKVLEDCIRIFKIEKTDEFKLIAYHFLNNVGSIFELKNISREVGVSFLTIDKYFGYLKESYLIEVLYRSHKSLIKQGRLLRKIYTPCINFISALNYFKLNHINEVPQVFGKIVENIIYNLLWLKYKNNKIGDSISFWRKGEKEIDFIVIKNNQHLPIEVKFSDNFNSKDLIALTDYLRKKKLAYGILITKNEIGKKEINGQLVYYIPYYLALMSI